MNVQKKTGCLQKNGWTQTCCWSPKGAGQWWPVTQRQDPLSRVCCFLTALWHLVPETCRHGDCTTSLTVSSRLSSGVLHQILWLKSAFREQPSGLKHCRSDCITQNPLLLNVAIRQRRLHPSEVWRLWLVPFHFKECVLSVQPRFTVCRNKTF